MRVISRDMITLEMTTIEALALLNELRNVPSEHTTESMANLAMWLSNVEQNVRREWNMKKRMDEFEARLTEVEKVRTFQKIEML